jgi:hypothetical protein
MDCAFVTQAFVGATIPAGIYGEPTLTERKQERPNTSRLCAPSSPSPTAKTHYGTSLANVDWLHGAAESLLTVTNLLIVLGLRAGIRDAEAKKASASSAEADSKGPQGSKA